MKKQQLIRSGAILAVAGVSFVVLQKPGAAPLVAPVAMAEAALPAPAAAAPEPAAEGPLTLAASPALPATAGAASGTGPVVLPLSPVLTSAAATAESPCHIDMVLLAQPGAMLDLGLLAPCQADQRVLIRHGDLVISGQTSAAGTLIASIPAFSSPAEVSLSFVDGNSVTQSAEVRDLAQFDRFAVQWMAGDDFALHAFTGAPDYGSPGHISADTPGKASAEGGFLTRLGDSSSERALLAEVYTWPAGQQADKASGHFSLEAEVTAASCGREILGETLQLSAGHLALRELSIEMPDCAAIGEFVVLPNPAAAEKLAAN